jgi:hypothetical protein
MGRIPAQGGRSRGTQQGVFKPVVLLASANMGVASELGTSLVQMFKLSYHVLSQAPDGFSRAGSAASQVSVAKSEVSVGSKMSERSSRCSSSARANVCGRVLEEWQCARVRAFGQLLIFKPEAVGCVSASCYINRINIANACA